MAPPTPAMLMECCRTQKISHDIPMPRHQLCISGAHAPHRRPRPSIVVSVRRRRTATTARDRRRSHDGPSAGVPTASDPLGRRWLGRIPTAPPPVRGPTAAHDGEDHQPTHDGHHWDEDRLVVGDPVPDLIAQIPALTVAVSAFPSALA